MFFYTDLDIIVYFMILKQETTEFHINHLLLVR